MCLAHVWSNGMPCVMTCGHVQLTIIPLLACSLASALPAASRLWENETDQDCYLKPGDTMVHYSPPAGAEDGEKNKQGVRPVRVCDGLSHWACVVFIFECGLKKTQ